MQVIGGWGAGREVGITHFPADVMVVLLTKELYCKLVR